MFEVSIIGCGPSAMMIAWACHQRDVPFRMYAPIKKSFISGAQYLHRDVGVRGPDLTPRTVKYERRGTEDGYEAKVYGKLPDGLKTSWSKFPDEVEAWPLIGIYDLLWRMFVDRISDISATLEQVMELGDRTLTFNTAPLPSLMPDAEYKTETVLIVDGESPAPADTIIYSGDPDDLWYRTSSLWGHYSMEFPHDVYMGVSKTASVIKKPLSTDAFIPNVILSGRYGRWEKGVLVDESYFQAVEELRRRGH